MEETIDELHVYPYKDVKVRTPDRSSAEPSHFSCRSLQFLKPDRVKDEMNLHWEERETAQTSHAEKLLSPNVSLEDEI